MNPTGGVQGTVRVLCVDDDRINTMLLGELCRLCGDVQMECADCGADAVCLATSWQPHLLVVDLHLPDTDGLRLLPRLREAAGTTGLAAVLCTAELPEDVAARAEAAGFDACWPKPVPAGLVAAAIARLRQDDPARP